MNKDTDRVKAKVFNGALSEIGWTDGNCYWSSSIEGLQANPKQKSRILICIYCLE